MRAILVRGNAVSTIAFAVPLVARPEVERSIARWAAGLVEDGDTIALDASTAVLGMASFLAGLRNLTVLTNGIEIGRQLARNASNRVLLVANMLSADGASVIGPCHQPALRSVKPVRAFVSCDGFSFAGGLTDKDAKGAAVKSRLVALADSTVALIEAGRYGRVYQGPFARADQLAHIFSDDSLEPEWADLVREASIPLTLCNPGA